jgi:hypothetical protein
MTAKGLPPFIIGIFVFTVLLVIVYIDWVFNDWFSMADEVQSAVIISGVAFVGWVLTVVGWIYNHWSSLERHKLEAALQHTERQLEYLYGPLVYLIEEGEQSFKDCLRKLDVTPEEFALSKVRQNEEDLNTWLFWVENDFMPRNEKMRQVLMQNAHLLEEYVMLDVYKDFISHYNLWSIEHRLWKEQGIEYPLHSADKYPDNFAQEARKTFNHLKSKHSNYLAQLR